MSLDEFSPLAEAVRLQKYSHIMGDGTKETWLQTSKRVASHVLNSVGASKDLIDECSNLIYKRKLIPGGRYLYATGRPLHQTQNCVLTRVNDSREGWSEHLYKTTMALTTGAGLGTVYSDVREEGSLIRGSGGTATGPCPLISATNEVGRGIKQGGSRRSALWSGLHWWHPDVFKYISLKDWPKYIRDSKEKDFNAYAPVDGTNISVILDTNFFKAYNDPNFSEIYVNQNNGRSYRVSHELAKAVYWKVVSRALKTGEPGFSIDAFENEGENNRNACQPSFATVLTPEGIRTLGEVEVGSIIWSGSRWTKITKKWSTGIKPVYEFNTTGGRFIGTSNHRVVSNGEKLEISSAKTVDTSVKYTETPTIDINDVMDGLVFGDGSVHKASNNLVHLYVGEKDHDYFESEISILFKHYRPGLNKYAWEIHTGITSDELVKTYNRVIPDRFKFGSFNKICGFLRGLFSANGCVVSNRVGLRATSLHVIKDAQIMLSAVGIRSYYTTSKPNSVKFSNGTYECKQSYMLNISADIDVFCDSIGFLQVYKMEKLNSVLPIKTKESKISFDIRDVNPLGEHEVFDITVEDYEHTYWTGGLLVSNCTEICSYDDSDICNLGSINLARIDSVSEMSHVVEVATAFLLAGTVYSDVPYSKIKETREKNRRIGLGIMGVHEWLLQHGKKYGPDYDLEIILNKYTKSEAYSNYYADLWNLSVPVKTRAIAPTGSIAIIGQTSSGCEPIFASAYKRRYLDGDLWRYQYVVDPIAKSLVQSGIDPDDIEDCYSISPDRRIGFQSWLQSNFVDHCISSTINIPSWGSSKNNPDRVSSFGDTLMKYLPTLRGVTMFPDGSRGSGQPLTSVSYKTAMQNEGEVFYESGDICDIRGGGSCGS